MYNELTNLLPSERQRVLAHGYFLRFIVVSAVLFSILVLAAAIMLIPTYVFLTKNAGAKETRLVTIESSLSSTNEKELSARLTALATNAAVLTSLASAPSASKIMSAVLAVSRPGITLSSFAYTPATSKVLGTFAVSGIAATRDALRNYQLALQGATFARSATLPVSAYAKDTAITFTITMTLAP